MRLASQVPSGELTTLSIFLIVQALKWTLGVGRNLPVVGTSISRCYATEGKFVVVHFIYSNTY